jgi:hypothetical protein
MDIQDLLAPVAGELEIADALETWRWLVHDRVKPLLVTALGDLVVVCEAGSVSFLDTMAGTFTFAADSVNVWEERLGDADFVERYFSPAFVMQLRDAGSVLTQGECYSPKLDPVLGGKFTIENWPPTSWRFHFNRKGRVHEAIKDLPDGTVITKWNYTEL